MLLRRSRSKRSRRERSRRERLVDHVGSNLV